KYDVDFYIDIHAHSTLMNGFMYGNTFDDVDRLEKQSVFPKLLRVNADDFSMSNTNFNRDAVKAGTGRRTLGSCLGAKALCYTLEVSFFSYMNGATGMAQPYTEAGYMKLGRNLARTFLDYYKLRGEVVEKSGPNILLFPKAVSNLFLCNNKGDKDKEKPQTGNQKVAWYCDYQ
ncbi:hypothetical protein Ahia01_001374300, partial [Argonauta hians]